MDKSQDKIKKSIDYKVLIKAEDAYYDIGTIIIKTYTGDILYTPSSRFMNDEKTKNKKEIDHVSWHASGQVHIKQKDQTEEKYSIVQKNGERQKISEIGFQELLQDTIEEYRSLQTYQKKVNDLDVVFNAEGYDGPVSFYFSIVSGRLIVAKHKGQQVPIKKVNVKDERDGIDSTLRALGHHSGSGDILLQYSLRKISPNKIRTKRELLILHDIKISKLNITI